MNITFARKPGYGSSLTEYGFNTVNGDRIRPMRQYGLIWRWGYVKPIGNVSFTESVTCINRSESIKIISGKYSFLDKLKNEIRVPQVTKSKDEVLQWFKDNPSLIVLGRKFNHHGGLDIQVLHANDPVVQSDYYVKYIPKTREFRIYTFFGKVLEVQEKFPEDINEIAWNHCQGATFHNVSWNNWISKSCYLALKAAELTEIHYCAWDIILGKDHNFYVLEGNTAPSITGEYNLGILNECVEYLSAFWDENHKLPDIPRLGDFVRGYQHYIHPIMLERKENVTSETSS